MDKLKNKSSHQRLARFSHPEPPMLTPKLACKAPLWCWHRWFCSADGTWTAACTCPGTSCLHAPSYLLEENKDDRDAKSSVMLELMLWSKLVWGRRHTLSTAETLTSEGTLSGWGVLSDEGQELVLSLLEGDFTVPYSLRQPWLRHSSLMSNSVQSLTSLTPDRGIQNAWIVTQCNDMDKKS